MKIIITERQLKMLNENIQLSDKIYFQTGKLSPEDKELVLSITRGDNYTKFVCDILYDIRKLPYEIPHIKNRLEIGYGLVKGYNKNVLPIKDFVNVDKVGDIEEFLSVLRTREIGIKVLKQIPSIGIRNLKNEIRTPRNRNEMLRYVDRLQYFGGQLSLLSNREENSRNKIYQKMFKNNITIDDLIDFCEDKDNLINGSDDVTKDEIYELIKENDYDYSLVYDYGNIMVVRVESAEGIKNIGCNSLWCFTYGSGFEYATHNWDAYSTNGMVYLIIDFRLPSQDSDFMNVVIKPIDFSGYKDKQQLSFDFGDEEEKNEVNDEKIYDLFNNPQYDVFRYLENTIGINNAKEVLTFKWD